jgi:hypothetical protein
MSHKKKKHQKELAHQNPSSLKQISGGSDTIDKVADSKLEERFKKRHDKSKSHHHY